MYETTRVALRRLRQRRTDVRARLVIKEAEAQAARERLLEVNGGDVAATA